MSLTQKGGCIIWFTPLLRCWYIVFCFKCGDVKIEVLIDCDFVGVAVHPYDIESWRQWTACWCIFTMIEQNSVYIVYVTNFIQILIPFGIAHWWFNNIIDMESALDNLSMVITGFICCENAYIIPFRFRFGGDLIQRYIIYLAKTIGCKKIVNLFILQLMKGLISLSSVFNCDKRWHISYEPEWLGVVTFDTIHVSHRQF